MKIGDKIKSRRIELKMTQRALAKKLKIPYSTLANYENNYREPNIETLNKIANALEVSTFDLIPDANIEDINLDNYINVKNTKDIYGVQTSRILSDKEVAQRKGLYMLLQAYDLLPEPIIWEQIDLLATKLIPHLKIFVDEVKKDSDK